MAENTVITENLKEFEQENKNLGEYGLHLPLIDLYGKTAFQSMVERWCGTVDLVYALYDFPEVVEECLSVIQANTVYGFLQEILEWSIRLNQYRCMQCSVYRMT